MSELMPRTPVIKHHSRKLILLGGMVVILIAGYWLVLRPIGAPFRNSRTLLQQEFASLHLADTSPNSEHFRGGSGLDNLPELTGTYTIPQTALGAERTQLAATLEAHGYRDMQQGYPQNIQLVTNTSDLMGDKGRFSVILHLGVADLSAGNSPAGTTRPIQDSDLITSFSFTIYDHGDTTPNSASDKKPL
ncbi:MAG TPA: hypothetical protein VLG92_03645 [Candidatus Saccharimonadia bacterium]|nr:hypothetical protein [Candidatus Saccharimonadia bacterium]